jgi:hypothetical protein
VASGKPSSDNRAGKQIFKVCDIYDAKGHKYLLRNYTYIYKFSYWFVWVWDLVSYSEGKPKFSAEENIWNEEIKYNRWMKKLYINRDLRSIF